MYNQFTLNASNNFLAIGLALHPRHIIRLHWLILQRTINRQLPKLQYDKFKQNKIIPLMLAERTFNLIKRIGKT